MIELKCRIIRDTYHVDNEDLGGDELITILLDDSLRFHGAGGDGLRSIRCRKQEGGVAHGMHFDKRGLKNWQ